MNISKYEINIKNRVSGLHVVFADKHGKVLMDHD